MTLRTLNRGVGGMGTTALSPVGSAITPCSWIQSLFGGYYAPGTSTWITCAQAAANPGSVAPNTGPGGSPSLPPQYAISQIGSDPTPPSGYTSVPMGADSTGTQQYAYIPDAQTQQQQNLQSITDQMAAQDTGGDSTNPTLDCSWLDSTGVVNNLFNPSCGTPLGLYAIAGVVLILVLQNRKGN